LHSLLIIMGYFLGQHNPSNYFALTNKIHISEINSHINVDF
jgi:hypothetical protein